MMNLMHRLAQCFCILLFIVLSCFPIAVLAADSKSSAWDKSAGYSFDYSNRRFQLTLFAPTTVQIDLISSVDTYLYVLNNGGGLIAEDDDSGRGMSGMNSRLTLTLNAGKYQLVAATFFPDQRADFTISTSAGVLDYCFQAFIHRDYRGGAYQFCDSFGAFVNDAYSSLRVPKGMYVRAYEHSGGRGRGRTYFYDTPWVGPGFNDIISDFNWGDFQTNDFFMAILSDSQFSWRYCSDTSDDFPESKELCVQENKIFAGWSEENISRYYNKNVVDAINKIQQYLGEDRFGGTIVNGDLTEWGDQDVDLGDYRKMYELGVQSNVYPGLGNHDYEINVNDCRENKCATSMVWYLAGQVATLNASRFDYRDSGTYYQFPSYRRDYSGSLAYSWDIGNVHFVQLNYYPTYTRKWNSWNFPSARRDYVYITSSIPWLRSDLEDAVKRGQKIILNMHDWHTAKAGIAKVIDDFPVSAVYAGHQHDLKGREDQLGPYADGKITPVYLSGAPYYGTFLVVRYRNGQLYTWVMVVDQFKEGKLQVLYNGEYLDATDLANIFDVCPDCQRYYADVVRVR